MNTEFNWWLLIVGLVIGAGLVWLVLADTRRRETDVADGEREGEARWIGDAMRGAGRRISDAEALDVLRLHEAYLAAPPPDEPDAAEGGVEPWAAPAEARTPMAHPIGTPAHEPAEPAGER